MLTSLRLRNFKSYRDTGSVALAPLTIVIGCNNAGKSALLQSLLALKQTLMDPSWATRLVTSGPLVDLGGFYDILHGGKNGSNGNARQGIQIDISRDDEKRINAPEDVEFTETSNLSISFSFNRKSSKTEVKSLVFSNDSGQPVGTFSESGEWATATLPKRHQKYLSVMWRNFLVGATLDPQTTSKIRDKLTESLFDQMMAIEMQTHSWSHTIHAISHVAPLRLHVPWYSGVARRYISDFGKSGEELGSVGKPLFASGSHVWQIRS